MWWFVLAIVVCFLAVHAAKMLRLYLVLMEHKIGFNRFLLLYCKTTFVNLVIPSESEASIGATVESFNNVRLLTGSS